MVPIAGCTGLPAVAEAVAAPAIPGEPARADTLVLWHSFRGREQAALELVLASWSQDHRRPPILAVARDGNGFTQELAASVRRGDGPDIVIWAHDKTGEWADQGVVVPLDEDLTAALRDRYLPFCFSSMSYQGRQYGLPLSFETLIMYYNRALVPTPPRTTDEMIRVARQNTNRARNRWGLVYERGNFYHHAMWLHGFGGRVFDDSGQLALQSPETVRSLTFARDLARVHHVVPDTVDWQTQMDLFNAGRAAILLSGPWAYGSVDQTRVSLGIAPLPQISGLNRYPSPFLGVKGFFITASCRDRAAASAAIDHLTSTYSSSMLNVLAGYLPADRLAYDFSIVSADYVTSIFKEQVGRATVMPTRAEMSYVWQVMMTDPVTLRPGALDRIFLYGIEPRTALRDAAGEYERLRAADLHNQY